MKPSNTETGPADRKFVQRLQALIRPARKKTHRFSANVTGEDDWEVDEPQIRMSRAFAVMLVLHLVAVGGLFAFHMFGKDDSEAEGAATLRAHETSPPPPVAPPVVPGPAAPAMPAAAVPVIPRAQIVEETDSSGDAEQTRQHVMAKGENVILLAAKFGIAVSELEAANAGSEFKTGDILTIPPHQRVIGAVPGNPEEVNPPLALIVATPAEDVGHRDFALKEGADNPYAPVAAKDLEEVLPEAPAPRAKLVKAEPEADVAGRTEDDSEAVPEVPAARAKKSTPPPAVVKPKPATGSRTHVIQKGDTIYNVAKRYGLSPAEVMRANGISDPSRVQMGQVLKIAVKR